MYQGHLLANVWPYTNILKIDIDTGDVLESYDMQALYDDVDKI